MSEQKKSAEPEKKEPKWRYPTRKQRAWKLGDPFRVRNKNPNMLEGIPAIATFIGKSPSTTDRWIKEHGLPATKTPGGNWLTHKALILAWIYAGHKAEISSLALDAIEPEGIEALGEKMAKEYVPS